MKKLLILALTLGLGIVAYSQDKIYKHTNDVISCKVLEIGLNEIKYKLSESDLEDSPTISIAIEKVHKVVFANGREITFQNPLTDPESYVNDRKKAVKLHFLSPLMDQISFSYEKVIKPGRSMEYEVGFIGLGFNPFNFSSSGAYLSTGYKFMRSPDFYSQRFKYAHILKGGYVKPQFLLSIYNTDLEFYNYNTGSYREESKTIVAGAVLINLGKQIVFDNAFLIDYSVGFGYGVSNVDSVQPGNGEYREDSRDYHYGFLLGESTFPFAIATRLKIGLLIK